MYAEKLFTNFK